MTSLSWQASSHCGELGHLDEALAGQEARDPALVVLGDLGDGGVAQSCAFTQQAAQVPACGWRVVKRSIAAASAFAEAWRSSEACRNRYGLPIFGGECKMHTFGLGRGRGGALGLLSAEAAAFFPVCRTVRWSRPQQLRRNVCTACRTGCDRCLARTGLGGGLAWPRGARRLWW